MTGEVSLTGRVLPVGGIKEKVMAARRSNVRTLVLPAGNRKDFVELPEHLRDGLAVTYAVVYADVAAVAFEYPAALLEQERARLLASHPSHASREGGGVGGGGSIPAAGGAARAAAAAAPAWMVVAPLAGRG
jgi:predicted S18 family serine protease